jgi:hypothetical protein
MWLKWCLRSKSNRKLFRVLRNSFVLHLFCKKKIRYLLNSKKKLFFLKRKVESMKNSSKSIYDLNLVRIK